MCSPQEETPIENISLDKIVSYYLDTWIMLDSVEPGCVEKIKYYPKTKQQEIHEKYPDIVKRSTLKHLSLKGKK